MTKKKEKSAKKKKASKAPAKSKSKLDPSTPENPGGTPPKQ